MKRILVIGSANIDLVTRVPRCPRAGESLIGSSFATITGGKGANQAVAAARLGAAVAFAGCVGADGFGELQRAALRAEGIDLAHLKLHPTVPTGTAVIMVGDDGQNSIVVTPGANFEVSTGDIEAMTGAIAEADVVLLQLEIPLEAVAAALRVARRSGTLSILDAGPAQKVPGEILALTDVVSPNETEAFALTGIEVVDPASREAAARALMAAGAREVVLKLGAAGSMHFGADGGTLVGPFAVDAVDTTAAGDAYTAALALNWGSGPVSEVLRFANAVGALAATRHGAQPSMPTKTEVQAFLEARN